MKLHKFLIVCLMMVTSLAQFNAKAQTMEEMKTLLPGMWQLTTPEGAPISVFKLLKTNGTWENVAMKVDNNAEAYLQGEYVVNRDGGFTEIVDVPGSTEKFSNPINVSFSEDKALMIITFTVKGKVYTEHYRRVSKF